MGSLGVFSFAPFLALLSLAYSPNSNITSYTSLASSQNACTLTHDVTDESSIYSFPFVIPFGMEQSCNIYGPTCQPGSVTVNSVARDCHTVLVTFPCSSYLASQSTFLYHASLAQTTEPSWLKGWEAGFGRSPECHSYADFSHEIGGKGSWTFSECLDEESIVPWTSTGTMPPQIPPFVVNGGYFENWECCGSCYLDTPEVRLYYFEETNFSNCSSNTSVLAAPNTVLKNNRSQELHSNVRRIASIPPGGNLAVMGGQTLTSPSVYLQFVGTVGVTDYCGPLGSPLTSQLVAFPPGALSTYEITYGTVGEELQNPLNEIYHGMMLEGLPPLKALSAKDLRCPTFGVGTSTNQAGTVVTTVGPPWLPMISPPPEILSLNPKWISICKRNLTFDPIMKSLAIFDPPRVLTCGEGLVPDPYPPASPDPTSMSIQQNHVPQPAQTLVAGLPLETGGHLWPTSSDPKPASDGAAAQPTSAGNDPHDGDKGGAVAGNRNTGSSEQYRESSTISPIQEAPAKGHDSAGQDGSVSDNQQDRSVEPLAGDPKPPDEDVSPSSDDTLDPYENLGDLTKQGLGQDSPSSLNSLEPDISHTLQNAAPPSHTKPMVTIGGQTLIAAATGIVVMGTSVEPGGPAVLISGTPVVLDSSGVLAIGSKSISLSSYYGTSKNPAPEPSPIIIVGGHLFTGNADGFSMGSTAVSPGAPALTISGTRISLGFSGLLLMGSETNSLPVTHMNADPAALTIAGQVVTPNPDGFLVGTATVLPGGRDIVVADHSISLGTNGVLDVGGSATTLVGPAGNETSSRTRNGTILAFAGNANSQRVTPCLLSSVALSFGTYILDML